MSNLLDLSVVIPWRGGDDYREDLFDFVLDRYSYLIPEAKICIGECDGEIFNRGLARNKGFEFVDTKYVMFADADTVFNPFFLTYAYARLRGLTDSGKRTWFLPYDEKGYYNLTEKYTQEIIAQGYDFLFPARDTLQYEHELESWAGLLLMPSEAFREVGGYDSQFVGWGYEDVAMRCALDTLWAPLTRLDEAYVLHLWHPAPESTRFEQPYIQTNQRRYLEYQLAYGQPNLMRNLRGMF